MTEDKINALRQADTNLRDALKMDEAERPQMPADLNDRLMQRMAVSEKPVKRRIVWPWIAAASVAGVMIVWLMPPKDTPKDVVADIQPEVETPIINNKVEMPKVEDAPIAVPTIKAVKKARKKEKPLLAKETKVEEPAAKPAIDEAPNDLAKAETANPQEKKVTLTERDIPITRPENYKYTPEEIALMKKQANEAYLKWAQLELEIAKHQLEQTAQNQ
jgi:hypothetical protein